MKASLKNFSQFPFSSTISELFTAKQLPWTIIYFGIFIRLVQYFTNRSLWADEAVLALNIVNRSYGELLQPLDYEQGAPIGFLWIEKLAIQLLGNHEFALRLFPLICGIASLFLLWELGKRCLHPQAIPIALTLQACLFPLIYFSTEVKQYSSDVAIALFSCLLVVRLNRQQLSLSWAIVYSLVGAILVWSSHPAIFVLAGVGCSYLWLNYRQKKNENLFKILAIYSTWALSFIAFFLFSLNQLSSQDVLLESWENKGGFPSYAFDIGWVLEAFVNAFHRTLGIEQALVGVTLFAFFAGCISGFKRKKHWLLILFSPVFFTFIAAALNKYPFADRLILFLSPFFIAIIAEGAANIWSKTKKGYASEIGNLFLIFLLALPIASGFYYIVQPDLREEIKPVISYVKENQQPGDTLYIFQRGIYQFLYYAEKYGYQEGDYILGVEDLDNYEGADKAAKVWQRYQADLDKLRGNDRVWILMSHVAPKSGEKKMILSYLDIIGKRVDTYKQKGAFVYLYDLSTQPSQ